jgi:hypothetical protein
VRSLRPGHVSNTARAHVAAGPAELIGRYRLTAKNNIELRRFCDLAAGEIESMTGKVTGFKIDSRGRVLSVV